MLNKNKKAGAFRLNQTTKQKHIHQMTSIKYVFLLLYKSV